MRCASLELRRPRPPIRWRLRIYRIWLIAFNGLKSPATRERRPTRWKIPHRDRVNTLVNTAKSKQRTAALRNFADRLARPRGDTAGNVRTIAVNYDQDALRLVKDFHQPRAAIYWSDLGTTGAVGWLAFGLVLQVRPFSIGMYPGAVVAALALYRGLCFVHEISDLKRAPAGVRDYLEPYFRDSAAPAFIRLRCHPPPSQFGDLRGRSGSGVFAFRELSLDERLVPAAQGSSPTDATSPLPAAGIPKRSPGRYARRRSAW
jgi:hypothetical protein